MSDVQEERKKWAIQWEAACHRLGIPVVRLDVYRAIALTPTDDKICDSDYTIYGAITDALLEGRARTLRTISDEAKRVPIPPAPWRCPVGDEDCFELIGEKRNFNFRLSTTPRTDRENIRALFDWMDKREQQQGEGK